MTNILENSIKSNAMYTTGSQTKLILKINWRSFKKLHFPGISITVKI